MTRERIYNILYKEWRVLAGDATTFLMISLLPLAILGEGIVAVWLAAKIGGETIAANPFFQSTLDRLITAFPAAASLPSV